MLLLLLLPEKDDHLYKTKKEKERKEIADKEDNVWNALFIRSDTALSAMAKKLDMAEVRPVAETFGAASI